MSKEITVLKKEVAPFVKQAKAVEIVDQKSMEAAVTTLTQINRFMDKVTEEKEKVTKPLNQALKAERARWKPIETVAEEAVGIIKGKMSAYQTAEMKRIREEEAKIAASAHKDGIEKSVAKMEGLDRPDAQVSGGVGKVKFKETQTLKITNEKKVPDEFWVIDDKKLLEVLKSGVQVPGAEIEVVQTPINYR